MRHLAKKRGWTRCPVREVREDAHFSEALRVLQLSEISPLTGWPDDYSGWLVTGVLQIEAARAERRAADLKKAAEK